MILLPFLQPINSGAQIIQKKNLFLLVFSSSLFSLKFYIFNFKITQFHSLFIIFLINEIMTRFTHFFNDILISFI